MSVLSSTPRAPSVSPRRWGSPALASSEPVRIEQVEVFAARSCTALARVRAVVALGDRLPADVVVELTCESSGEGGARAAGAPFRMWSERRYDGGRFVFEAHPPQAVLDAGHPLTVTVREAVRDPGRMEAPPIARSRFVRSEP